VITTLPALLASMLVLASADAFPTIDLARLPQETREPTTDPQGTKQPACVELQLVKLREQVETVVKSGDAEPAWHMVFSLLCGHSQASMQYLRWHMPERVAFTEFTGEGEDMVDFSWRTPAEIEPAKGHAWDALLEEGSTSCRLGIHFHTGGECFAYFDLRKVGNAWLVVKAGDGCI
jgi:hypothetical protein